jgi:hypothetical protein
MIEAAAGGGIEVCRKQIKLALLMDGLLWLPPPKKR